MPGQGKLTLFPYAMIMVEELAGRSSILKQMEERVASMVFDSSDTPWFITVDVDKPAAAKAVKRLNQRLPVTEGKGGGEGEGEGASSKTNEPFYPDIFNCPEFRQALRRFLERARNLIRRYGFCAFWVLKAAALARWWQEYITADAARRAELGLPFGVVEVDQAIFTFEEPEKRDAWLGPMHRVIRVRPLYASDKDYDYHVYDQDAAFIPTPATMWQAGTSSDIHPSRLDVVQQGVGDGLRLSVIPTSEFYDLVDMHQLLQETRLNHLFAESQAAQTLIVAHTKPINLKDTGIQNTPESRQFHASTVMDERINQAEETRMYTLAQAKKHLDWLQMRIAGNEMTGDTGPQIVKARRRALMRPSPVDEMIELNEDMQLAHVSRPTAILRLDEVELNFRRAVASAMKLPFSMTEGSAASNGGLKDEAHFFNGARSVESVEEKQLAATVLRERAFYMTFFEHVYAVTFGDVDMRELQRAQDTYEKMLSEMKTAKRLGEQLGRELAGMHDASETAREAKRREAEEAIERARSKTERQTVRVSLRRVRSLIQQMHRRGGGFARLTFQPGMTRDAINQLTGLLAIFDRGVLSAKTLEPYVQDVFGAGAKLREPPAPTAAGAGASGGSASKKRKPGAVKPIVGQRSKRPKLESESSKAKRKRATDESDAARRKQRDQQRRSQTSKPKKDTAPADKSASDDGSDSD